MSQEHSNWRPHPWHGLSYGDEAPSIVNAYIEITPFDLVKYEVDKATGYLRVDRPQRTSSQPPALYGFIPRTYCAENVTRLCPVAKRGEGRERANKRCDFVGQGDRRQQRRAVQRRSAQAAQHLRLALGRSLDVNGAHAQCPQNR